MNRQHLSVDELADAAEGSLDSERAAFAESHIAGCSDCQAQSEALREVTASLRAEPVPPMPQEVFRRLNDVICAREVTDRRITGLTSSTVDRRPALLVYTESDASTQVTVVTGVEPVRQRQASRRLCRAETFWNSSQS